jgi:hypothetical protein
MYTAGVRELRSGQILKFNLQGPLGSVRYMLDIADSNDLNHLLKNNCAVFIVPPGLESQFAGETALRQLHEQIASARLILVRPVVGQDVRDVGQVRNDLNTVLSKLIQKGCDPGEVPYLTDGNFGERQYIYRDEEIFIE